MTPEATCPQKHPTAVCPRYGSAYVHGIIRALWALWLRKITHDA